ncbi:MAG TPA: DUF5623 domain-containing protein [Asticcacaulis sp.]|nr:DUF5623 domain-containing protein [Asticcacaulis sp.]
MTLDSIQPKTVASIKRLARQLRSRDGILHHEALRIASMRAGFSNYRTALNYFGSTAAGTPFIGYPLFISTWWRDEQSRASGRETLLIHTKTPYSELLNRRQQRQNRYLGWFKLEAPDHMADERWYMSQTQARLHAAGAARTIAFIEATGLKPSGAKLRQAVPMFDDDGGLPGRDHYAVWRDALTGHLILTDEPYKSRIEQTGPLFDRRRSEWAKRNSWKVLAVDWGGMYYPEFGSKLYVAAAEADGYNLSGLVRKLNRMKPPISSVNWSGESGSTSEMFWTPGLLEKQIARRAPRKAPDAPVRQRNSISCTKSFSGERCTRPAAKLSLSHHRRVGELLKIAMLGTGIFSREGRALGSIQSELDEWLALEYPRDVLSDKQFKQYYYGEFELMVNGLPVSQRFGPQPVVLAEVRQILALNYPDSAPLRNMLKRIDGLITEV